MTENFINLLKEKDTQVQEARRVPNKLDRKRHTLRHIIVTMKRLRDKERILKDAREKQVVTYKGPPIRLSSHYSLEIFQARREWYEIFKMLRQGPTTKTTLPSKAII